MYLNHTGIDEADFKAMQEDITKLVINTVIL